MKYALHSEAAAEHRRQVAYYEQRQQGLGQRYHAEFRRALALACEARGAMRSRSRRRSTESASGFSASI